MVGLYYGFGLLLRLFIGDATPSTYKGGKHQEDTSQECVINFGHLIFEYIIGVIY